MQEDAETAPTADDHVPAPQFIQVATLTAPTADDQVPAVQSIHTVEAVEEDHVPAVQSMHVLIETAPTADDHVPATQSRHVLTETAPTAEDHVPATQFVQGEKPVVDHIPPRHRPSKKYDKIMNILQLRIILSKI